MRRETQSFLNPFHPQHFFPLLRLTHTHTNLFKFRCKSLSLFFIKLPAHRARSFIMHVYHMNHSVMYNCSSSAAHLLLPRLSLIFRQGWSFFPLIFCSTKKRVESVPLCVLCKWDDLFLWVTICRFCEWAVLCCGVIKRAVRQTTVRGEHFFLASLCCCAEWVFRES